MSTPINIITKNLGIIDGLETIEIINADTGEVIGLNQTTVNNITD
jgi:hypothetical protein